ncbi:MAG TPA: hypothetical protein VMK66_13965 [Myxococcales bacterium]|nr:hypothetical protein [Myxococcales bacterium]
MKAIRKAVWALGLLVAGAAAAYQVTGPVQSVSDTSIVVVQEKGKNKGEKFEMARTPDTKVTGDLKPGAKVTVEYTLTARSVEVKAEKAAKAAKKK